jgi:hypothetical protein
MTPNKSLELSCRIQNLMSQDMLQFLQPIFPIDTVKEFEKEQQTGKKRNRVYTAENTLMTMVVTAVQNDKSLQNSVNIFQEVFKRNCKSVIRLEQKRIDKRRSEAKLKPRGVGRPSKYELKLPVSKVKDISSNTAAYSKARSRLDLELVEKVFDATTSSKGMSCIKTWHGRIVYNTDGTYFQMQDTKSIPEKYRAQKSQNGTLQGYPQGLLQVLTQHGSGFISGFKIAGRTESELKVAPELVDQLSPHSLLLADDLYNCYAFLSLVIEKKIDIIVPEKKGRNYTIIKLLGDGDAIVELKKPKNAKPLKENQILPQKIVVRRIVYPDTENPKIMHVILTTLFDKKISKLEIVQKYASRWDIEITIREIKTMMDMNIARGKSEEIVFKEYGVALIAYNLLRRIIAQSVEKTDFSPQEDIFQKLFAPYQNILVDRKGRVYSRWSPGRPSSDHGKDAAATDT